LPPAGQNLARAEGIEPSSTELEAVILPLNYTRKLVFAPRSVTNVFLAVPVLEHIGGPPFPIESDSWLQVKINRNKRLLERAMQWV
jgi:hypothetical protein